MECPPEGKGIESFPPPRRGEEREDFFISSPRQGRKEILHFPLPGGRFLSFLSQAGRKISFFPLPGREEDFFLSSTAGGGKKSFNLSPGGRCEGHLLPARQASVASDVQLCVPPHPGVKVQAFASPSQGENRAVFRSPSAGRRTRGNERLLWPPPTGEGNLSPLSCSLLQAGVRAISSRPGKRA